MFGIRSEIIKKVIDHFRNNVKPNGYYNTEKKEVLSDEKKNEIIRRIEQENIKERRVQWLRIMFTLLVIISIYLFFYNWKYIMGT